MVSFQGIYVGYVGLPQTRPHPEKVHHTKSRAEIKYFVRKISIKSCCNTQGTKFSTRRPKPYGVALLFSVPAKLESLQKSMKAGARLSKLSVLPFCCCTWKRTYGKSRNQEPATGGLVIWDAAHRARWFTFSLGKQFRRAYTIWLANFPPHLNRSVFKRFLRIQLKADAASSAQRSHRILSTPSKLTGVDRWNHRSVMTSLQAQVFTEQKQRRRNSVIIQENIP